MMLIDFLMKSFKCISLTSWATLLFSVSIASVACAQTYSTQDAERATSGASASRSSAPPCATCGWVESCTWVEQVDPALVWAAVSGQLPPGSPTPGLISNGPAAESHFEIRIRMEDGSLRVLRQAEPMPLGMAVHFSDGKAKARAN